MGSNIHGSTRLIAAARSTGSRPVAPDSNENLLWDAVIEFLVWRHELNAAREAIKRDGVDWARASTHLRFDIGRANDPETALGQSERELARLQREVQDRLDALLGLLAREDWNGLPPRAVRLARREQLSSQHFLLLCAIVAAATEVGVMETGFLSGELKPVELHNHLDLGAQELLWLLSPKHFLQRLDIVRFDESSAWRRNELIPNRQVAALLRGLEVEDAALVALAPGAVREVLREEPLLRARIDQLEVPTAELVEEQDLSPGATPSSASLDEVLARLRAEIEDDEAEEGNDDAEDDSAAGVAAVTPGTIGPILSDFEYVQRHMDYFRARFRLRVLEETSEDDVSRRIGSSETISRAAMIRSLRSNAAALMADLRQRIRLSASAGIKLNGELLAAAFGISEVEKLILLTAVFVEMVPSFRGLEVGGHRSLGNLDVGTILKLFFDTDEEQVRARRLFDANAPLVRRGLLSVSTRSFLGSDLLTADIRVDQNVAEFVVGLEGVGKEIVAGSHLVHPEETLDQVVMNEADKRFVAELCRHFMEYVRAMQSGGAVDPSKYGNAPVIVLHGPPGTGKTLLARAIANFLGVPLLLSNSQALSEDALRAIFRVASMHRAVVFFDEADGIGRSRGLGGDPTAFVSEIERQNLICILATNRPQDLDEAVDDRVIKIAFFLPDPEQRKRIFELHLPPGMPLAEDVDLRRIAWSAELSGRRIKGAVMVAAARAVARDRENPVLTAADFEEGVRRQVVGRLSSAMLTGRRMPRRGLSKFVGSPEVLRAAGEIIGMARTRRTLDQWFRDDEGGRRGIIVLLEGPSGCGKTLLAEALAFELGLLVQDLRASDLVSKWVGETTKALTGVLDGAAGGDVLLAMDECEALLGGRTPVGNATDRYANLDVNTLLQLFDRFPGVLVLTTNLLENIDPAFHRRLDVVIRFERPGLEERARLWQLHMPATLPQHPDVNVRQLAASGAHTGGQIWKAVRRAAVRAAMREQLEERQVRMADLLAAAEDELAVAPSRSIGFVAT